MIKNWFLRDRAAETKPVEVNGVSVETCQNYMEGKALVAKGEALKTTARKKLERLLPQNWGERKVAMFGYCFGFKNKFNMDYKGLCEKYKLPLEEARVESLEWFIEKA